MNNQPDMFSVPTYFDGITYDHERDGERLESLLERVKRLMSDGRWRTLAEISRITGGSESSVSARLRDFRKERFGGHDVESRNVGRGLHQYRVRFHDYA